MTKADNGRHCDKCQKKAYDFSNTKAADFQRILAENNYNVCGRFNHRQMHAQPIVLPFWKKWLSAAMVLVGINLWGNNATAQQAKHKATKHKTSKHKVKEQVFTDAPSTGMVAINEPFQVSQDPVAIVEPDSSVVYLKVEQMPDFPGGIEKFSSFLITGLHVKEDFSGRIIASFIVEEDGHLSNLKIEKGGTESINQEVLKLIAQSPKWKPGLQYGKRLGYSIRFL